MSTLLRDDPELFAPRVIFNGTFAHRPADASEHFVTFTPWSRRSCQLPRLCLLEGDSNTQQHNRNILPFLLSANHCFKSDRPDCLLKAKTLSFPSRPHVYPALLPFEAMLIGPFGYSSISCLCARLLWLKLLLKAHRLLLSGVLPVRNFDKLCFVQHAYEHAARLRFGIWALNNVTLEKLVASLMSDSGVSACKQHWVLTTSRTPDPSDWSQVSFNWCCTVW